jgi:stage II sporulation protein D
VRNPLFIATLGAAACASALTREAPEPVLDGDQPVRIALAVSDEVARIGGTGSWNIYSRNSSNLVISGRPADVMSVEQRGGQLVVLRGNGRVTSRYSGPLLVRAITPESHVTYEGKRYRGELVLTPGSAGVLVVNRLGVESYLRGVVPLEIGDRKPGEEAAVEAQAVAARSYTYIHMDPEGEDRGFDMYGSVQDQAYGGVDGEKPISDAAVASTRDVVLKYAGRVINAPYHSTCGGSTAAVSEVWWRQTDQPYLRPVSDRIPGTSAFYCDPSPRFQWTQSFDADQLSTTLEKYLGTVTAAAEPAVSAPSTQRMSVGRVTGFRVEGRTPSDRVRAVSIQTERGNYVVRGNDVRFVLRTPGGSLLNSTYFTAQTKSDGRGGIGALVITGNGYGHGIGMCQWGAIGRARAGQDYRTILTTYYPGTTVGRVNQ